MSNPATKSEPATMGASAPAAARSHFPAWLTAVLLAMLTIAVYWPALRCDFIGLDDAVYVTLNSHVQGGLTWEGVKWAFSDTKQAAYWAPIMWLSHELDCQFFGLNPWGHHLMNVLLHAANTALVFLLFQRMTRATWRSLILAALFGLHPLRVESVAWVAERKDVLSAFFGLLCLMAYARYAGKSNVQSPKSKVQCPKSKGFYFLALLFFALGLMSKPMLVTLPCVLLLLDYWPLQRFKVQGSAFRVQSLVLEKIPFFALAVAASVVTFVTQNQGGAVMTVDSLPLGARVGNALISYCRYLGKTFWPTDLAVFYPHPGYWPLEEVLLAGAFLCGISALLFVKRRQCPFMLMGWLWFLGTLVPVIQLVQSGGQAMADRFTYFPSLGALVLAIWGAHELTRHWRHQVIVLSVAASAAIVLCVAVTRHQLGYWRDDETLFRHTLEVTRNNFVAHNNLGAALLKQGRTKEAIRQFLAAVNINPDDPDAEGKLAKVLEMKDSSVQILDPSTLNNLAWELATCPDAGIRNGALAVKLAERACELTHYRQIIFIGTLAAAYAEAGRFDEAVATGQKACALASELGATNLLKRNQELVILYQARQPYHEPIRTDSQ